MDTKLNKNHYTLCIETGIGGGSLSIFRGAKSIGSLPEIATNLTVLSANLKADYLLGYIEMLLKKTSVKKNDLHEIIFSSNPGSKTGLNIGKAVAKGLNLSLDLKITGKDLFECIAKIKLEQSKTMFYIILPINRHYFNWQLFNKAGICKKSGQGSSDFLVKIISEEKDSSKIKIYATSTFITDPDIVKIKSIYGELVDLGINLSKYLKA